MSRGEDIEIDSNNHDGNHHIDYGIQITTASANNNVEHYETDGVVDYSNGYEGNEVHEHYNDEHMNYIHAEDAGEEWDVVQRAESVDGEEGAYIDRTIVPAPVRRFQTYEPGMISIGPPFLVCNCQCHYRTSPTPDERLPSPPSPAPEGVASPSSMTVEISSGERSMVSSMYLSRTASLVDLHLVGAHLQSQRYFINRPLPVNGPVNRQHLMPRSPLQYPYALELSIHESESDG